MKKYFLLLMASACISVADAQLIKQNEEQKKQAASFLQTYLKPIWIGIIVLLIKMVCMEPR